MDHHLNTNASQRSPMKFLLISSLLISSLCLSAKDTFTPYTADNVPQNVTDLWKDYDARKENLDIQIIKEWQEEGVVVRYVTFKVGTFKGVDSRIAAYYCFPKGGSQLPAFVWSHGGGQKADKTRGVYFAKRGYATVDINWLGRPLQDDVDVHTDWGKIDPTLGPQFYKKALRKHWKHGLKPDEFTIDPVISPRNLNWFALVVAGRRAITFLETQKEVNANKIGFAGYSMGGMITTMTAIDPRLKAVAPFVGGTAYLYKDFPDMERTGNSVHFGEHVDLYARTMDPSAYWPLVKCPVMFINSSNDFHAAFDRVYQSMELIPHKNWRVSMNFHVSHAPSNEQWIMLDKWFDQHLKNETQRLAKTPVSELKFMNNKALYSLKPDNEHLVDVEIYYSHDPNSITRFWNRATSHKKGEQWFAEIDHQANVPLYVSALCRYALKKEGQSLKGATSTYVVNALEHSLIPEDFKYENLKQLAKETEVFEDFKQGTQDWYNRSGNLSTYKFQNPALNLKGKKLCLNLNPGGKKYLISMNTSSRFLGLRRDQSNYFFNKVITGNEWQKIIVSPEDFKTHDKKTEEKLEWEKVVTFTLSIMDMESKQKVDLTSEKRKQLLQSIDLVK